MFTAYGLTAAVAAWLSGALSDLWGPAKVMWAGLGIWVAFHAAFLLLGVAPNRYPMILAFYALRGFGYPGNHGRIRGPGRNVVSPGADVPGDIGAAIRCL